MLSLMLATMSICANPIMFGSFTALFTKSECAGKRFESDADVALS